MLSPRRLIFSSLLGIFSLFISTESFSFHKNSSFENSEHLAAGEKIKLYFHNKDQGQLNPLLQLQNGLSLTYAQLIALSGDFYGIPEETISESQSFQERKEKFRRAYATLAEDPAALKEAPQLVTLVQNEYATVIEGMQKGRNPEDIYKEMNEYNDRQKNCITGGGCASLWWLTPGRYLLLSNKNYDHFGRQAWLAYQAGHAVALEAAIKAHQTQDSQLLETAYAMNAYASHFLSDCFSSGHMRIPRVELSHSVTPSTLGSILVMFMHDEDGQYGLHVHNLQGDHWVAFGDKYFFDSQNEINRFYINEALQKSANEIFYAYTQGVLPEDAVKNLLPEVDDAKNSQDVFPLFYFDSKNQILYRRMDVANMYDSHMTSDWWGWSTLILLASQRGLPTISQQALVAAGYGKQAAEYGLLIDKTVICYMNKKAI